MPPKTPDPLTLPLAFALLLLGVPAICTADEGTDFFEKKIRPILVTHCYECHSSDSKKLGGNLLLDHRDGVLKGGDTSPAIDPGKPEKSLLLTAIKYEDDGLKMPPKGKLPAAAIADLEAWIKMGAPDPRLEKPKARVASSWEEILRTRSDWWSLQPVKKPVAPAPKNGGWSDHPVDHFILAKLEERGLAPVDPAQPRTLIRRLSLVLTGLPPSSEQVASFVQEYEAAAKSAKPQAGAQIQGKSFLHSLRDEKAKGSDEVYASHTFHEITMYYPMKVVRTRTHKLLWNIAHPLPFPFASDLWDASTWQDVYQHGPDTTYGKRTVTAYIHRPQFELYDLVNDPDEVKNLATDPANAKLLEELKGKIKAFQKRTNDPWILKWEYE